MTADVLCDYLIWSTIVPLSVSEIYWGKNSLFMLDLNIENMQEWESASVINVCCTHYVIHLS